MHKHIFLFTDGVWLGQGTLELSGANESFPLFTKWEITAGQCKQTVEIPTAEHKGINHYTIVQGADHRFTISLKNETIEAEGTGTVSDREIQWKFHQKDELEGLERFVLQENGEYLFEAKFFSAVQQETLITGRIWKSE